MNIKGGHYDSQAEKLIHELNASMVMLVVVNGEGGHGMSVCIDGRLEQAQTMAEKVPELLRRLANEIEHHGEFRLENRDVKSWSDLANEKGDKPD